jgi:predicted dehydrogenase
VLEHFVAVATCGATLLVTAADGAAAVQIADACYRSARDGRRVAVLGR